MSENNTKLNFNLIPEATANIFKEIASEPMPVGFYLIGGTCLSLQTGHRPSEDLDFSTLNEKIDGNAVSGLISRLRSNGHDVKLSMNQGKISQAKINGYNLLDFVRDYVVDGKVKLTFVALRYQSDFANHLKQFINDNNDYKFPMLSIDGIFATKSLLLEKRIKSRDLFDLNYLFKTGDYQLEDLVSLINKFGENGYDYAKSVLTGLIPVDANDEGFSSLTMETTLESIYTDLKKLTFEYEVREAARISKALKERQPLSFTLSYVDKVV